MPVLYPLIQFGSTDSFVNWSPGGGMIISAGADPFGGNTGVKMSGSSGVSIGNRSIAWKRDGYQEVQAFVSGGLATTTSSMFLLNNSNGQTSMNMNLYWNSTGCYSSSIGAGYAVSGGVFQPVQLGTSGWSVVRFSVVSMSIANQAQLRFSPNINGIGTVNYYNRSSCFSAYGLYQPVSYDKARNGSDWVQSAAGSEDAWIVGTDNYLTGQIRWINPNGTTVPMQAQSGWFGDAEDIGINCGWKGLIKEGTNKSSMRWIMNWYSFPGKYYDCYLHAPIDGTPPTVEHDWTFALPLTVRNPSGSAFELY